MSELPAPSNIPKVLVVIGASTGGTRVLSEIFSNLPASRACYLVVQHMPRFINGSLVQTLTRQCVMPVRLVEDGDALTPGMIHLAPSEVHCLVGGNSRLRLSPGPKVNFVCPSIDVTMRSIRAQPAFRKLIAVVLTGMGRDGADGLAHLKSLGAMTVAQNERTCAVYGMPAEAVRTGCVDHQLPPEAITRLLAREAV